MTLARREFLRVAAAAAAVPALLRAARAETYPTRPVRILVATSAGGTTDLVARILAQRLGDRLGQSFIVENRPGGGNNIGTEAAARSPADGYTLFMANTVNTINNSLYQKLSYNFIADFAPVANVMGTPLLVLVHPSVAAKNAAELIALAKASPGKLNLASGGVGSTGHMSAELFQMMASIKFTHVPYRGEAPALTDLIAGQAQLMVSTTGSSLQYAKAGTVRALATTTDDRVAELPDVPPLSKTVPGYRANAWNGLCGPKGMPPEIITLLNKEVNLAMADPKIKARIASLGGVALPGSPEDYGRTIAVDTEKWAKVVKFAGVKPE
jgi:tripartite-type tricarboxylate transporter receptor subunit TctC